MGVKILRDLVKHAVTPCKMEKITKILLLIFVFGRCLPFSKSKLRGRRGECPKADIILELM